MEALNIRSDGRYLDATLGRGGHSLAITERLGPEGRLVAVDRDPDAVRQGLALFSSDARVRVMHGAFRDIDCVVASVFGDAEIDGLVADLGVSSPQLDQAERGFAFSREGRLDMRMDPGQGIDAATWLATAGEEEICGVIRDLGEERYARRIARAIVAARGAGSVTTTTQLAEIVSTAVPRREADKHPATRTFQAIRMFINDELEQLRALLPKAARLLAEGGRLVVISFHSLEDRVVKRFMRDESVGDPYPPDLPVPASALRPRLRIIGKAVRPCQEEVLRNPRARSAVMRVAERTGVAYA